MAKRFSHTPRKKYCPAAIRLAWREHFSDDELASAYAQVATANRRVRSQFDVPVQFTVIDWLDLRVRAHHCCEYCGSGEWELVIDHHIPLTKGGAHTKENIRVACARCNRQKLDRLGAPPRVIKPSAVAQLLHEYANYARDAVHAAWETKPDLARTVEEHEDHEQWLREQRAKTAVPDQPWLKKMKERAVARKRAVEDIRRKNGNLHDEAHKACKECRRKGGRLCQLHHWKYIGVRQSVKCLEGTTCLVINCRYCQEHATG